MPRNRCPAPTRSAATLSPRIRIAGDEQPPGRWQVVGGHIIIEQALARRGAVDAFGYAEVQDVRVGKFLELEVDATSRESAEARVREMCDKLLANPVIEDYRFEISPES